MMMAPSMSFLEACTNLWHYVTRNGGEKKGELMINTIPTHDSKPPELRDVVSLISPWGQRFAVGDLWEGEPIQRIYPSGNIETEHYVTRPLPQEWFMTLRKWENQ